MAFAVLLLCPSVAGLGVTASPAVADVTAVSGGAFGHYTKVGLFGGPQAPVGGSRTSGRGPTGTEGPPKRLTLV